MALEASSRRELLLEPEPGVIARDAILEERVGEVEEKVRELKSRVESIKRDLDEAAAALATIASEAERSGELRKAAEMIGSWKLQTCIYQVNGICTLWRLSREAAERLGESITVEDSEEQGVYRIRVSAAPWFCALCPLYQRRVRL